MHKPKLDLGIGRTESSKSGSRIAKREAKVHGSKNLVDARWFLIGLDGFGAHACGISLGLSIFR